MKILFKTVIALAVITVSQNAIAGEAQFWAYLDVDCSAIRTKAKIEEVYRAELGKILDLVLVKRSEHRP